MPLHTRRRLALAPIVALVLAACGGETSGPPDDPEDPVPDVFTSADLLLSSGGSNVGGIIVTISGATVDSVVGVNTVAGIIAQNAAAPSAEFLVAGESLQVGVIARVYFRAPRALAGIALQVTEVVGGPELAALSLTTAPLNLVAPTATLTKRALVAAAPATIVAPAQRDSGKKSRP